MTTKRTTLAALAAAALLAGCGSTHHHPPGGGDARKTIEELNDTWNQAFAKQNARALAALYADDAVVSPGNGTVVRGRDAIQTLFQSFFDAGLARHSIEVVQARGHGPTLDQVANWSASGGNLSFKGVLATHHERTREGRWELVSHVWNTPPAK